MTDTERIALERRIDELCAELGRSQLNRDMWHDRAEDMRNRLSAAHAENAKLRELCAELYAEYRYLRCRHHRMYVQHEKRMRGIEDRMRELGIEVN